MLTVCVTNYEPPPAGYGGYAIGTGTDPGLTNNFVYDQSAVIAGSSGATMSSCNGDYQSNQVRGALWASSHRVPADRSGRPRGAAARAACARGAAARAAARARQQVLDPGAARSGQPRAGTRCTRAGLHMNIAAPTAERHQTTPTLAASPQYGSTSDLVAGVTAGGGISATAEGTTFAANANYQQTWNYMTNTAYTAWSELTTW